MQKSPEKKAVRAYSGAEEIWHSSVHGFGIIFGISILTLLVVFASIYGNVWSIISCAIFGASVIVMYTASTLYHLIPSVRAKIGLKKFDHIAIYYLIAGTYTPFLLIHMRTPLGWTLFGIVWVLAFLGTYLKVHKGGAGTKLWSIGLYVGMGWLIAVASKQLAAAIPTLSLTFLILGGLFYTLGIFFYVWKSRKYTHAIWHFFVLMGTIMHFFAVLFLFM